MTGTGRLWGLPFVLAAAACTAIIGISPVGPAPDDAGAEPDAGGRDTGTASGLDAAVDATVTDAGAEDAPLHDATLSDADADSGNDAAVDAGPGTHDATLSDAVADAGPSTPDDSGADASLNDAGVDAPVDAGFDAPSDASLTGRDGGALDAAAFDAGPADAGPPDAPCSVANGCYVVPTGWTLVAFAQDQKKSCPPQSTVTDVYEGPQANANGCACSCSVATQPTCAAGPINVRADSAGHSLTCSIAGVPAQMQNSGGCNSDMFTGAGTGGVTYQTVDVAYTAPGPTGGTCTPTAVAGSVTTPSYQSQDVICTPNSPPCVGATCTPAFGAGLSVCITKSGSVSCPGTTFTTPHTVGGVGSFQCSVGNCACQIATSCTGNVVLYTGNSCSGSTLSVPADGVCRNPNSPYSTFASYSYTPVPGASCAESGTPTATPVQTNIETVCCAP